MSLVEEGAGLDYCTVIGSDTDSVEGQGCCCCCLVWAGSSSVGELHSCRVEDCFRCSWILVFSDCQFFDPGLSPWVEWGSTPWGECPTEPSRVIYL